MESWVAIRMVSIKLNKPTLDNDLLASACITTYVKTKLTVFLTLNKTQIRVRGTMMKRRNVTLTVVWLSARAARVCAGPGEASTTTPLMASTITLRVPVPICSQPAKGQHVV